MTSLRMLPIRLLVVLSFGAFILRAGDARETLRFRLVISEGVIGAEVNESDANVAMQAWRDAVARQVGLQIDVHVANLARLVHEVRENQVDGFTLTTPEFIAVQNYSSPTIVMDAANSKGGDEYLLLVHDEGGIRSLADLRHKLVNVYDNREMSLANFWLENLLAAANLGTPPEFFGRVAIHNKLSPVVLPVYFRQADACLVTRRGFATMSELNPQLGRKLRILCSSPKLITSFMAFHKDCPPAKRQQLQSALASLHKTAAGQQALTLFESGQLVMGDYSLLRTTLDLVKDHDRLHAKLNGRK